MENFLKKRSRRLVSLQAGLRVCGVFSAPLIPAPSPRLARTRSQKPHLPNIFEQKSRPFYLLLLDVAGAVAGCLAHLCQKSPTPGLKYRGHLLSRTVAFKQPFPEGGSTSKCCSWLPVFGVYRMHAVYTVLHVACC